MWSSDGGRKGVEAGQKTDQPGKEGEEKGEKGQKKEGGAVAARAPEEEGSVIFRDFFTPFFAGRLVHWPWV
jgi:hypothetical protein